MSRRAPVRWTPRAKMIGCVLATLAAFALLVIFENLIGPAGR